MKTYLYFSILCLLFFNIVAKGQSAPGDSTISFKVHGTCGQCKQRIEKAAKVNGVTQANWDISTKMLTVIYDPLQVTLPSIKKNILNAGHDVEDTKATDRAYGNLPPCCNYRDLEKEENKSSDLPGVNDKTPIVKGMVLEADKKGNFKPLTGASVIWLNTTKGATTNNDGFFEIAPDNSTNQLIVSYSGFTADTIAVNDSKELKIVLASNHRLKEVVVTAKQRSTYVSAFNPIRTEVLNEKELFKSACCNLSESFETNPSVDVSYSDAVTGSKQIQLLGLSGIYTQLTVENLPGPRGIATPLGLNSIPGTWVESIQLIKGTGSVANGFESIAGQINVELKEPETAEKLYANAYVNDGGKTDLNLNLAKKVSDKWSTILLLHDDFLANKNLDFNKDGFRDLPTGNQFSALNRWQYEGENYHIQLGIKLLNDDKTGGQIDFNPQSDKFTTNHYGLGINTKRYEAFAKTGYMFPAKKYKSIGLQLSAISHEQNSYFGLTKYDATQKTFYSNLIYQSIIGNTNHKFRTGLSFSHDDYNETFNANNYLRTENVSGGFFEYTYDYLTKLTIVAGLRGDYNNLYGWFATPRLNIRYEPIKGTTIRLSAGRGQRTANIFAENMGVFVSARQIIITAANNKGYGLDPEVAWNKGISIDQKLKLFSRSSTLSFDFYRNDFTNQVVVNLENPTQIKFYNLAGKSYSNSFQAQLNFEPVKKLDVRLAYRYFDVKTTYSGTLLERPFTAANRAFANFAYELKGWKLDYTLSYTGSKRIPNTEGNPAQYQLQQYSPEYVTMNAQLTKTLGKKFPVDVYIGGENLTNYFQKDVIVQADQPFGEHFDASMVWGPVYGRMFYAGLRFKLK
ncbi:TonB-dependent receptor domain-containing protein [Ferruginibacter albus]|uniref:TonB-dependent receptor domain-containing protein n=1 Tax=Ferruginibacter albus TaxID=2875540 RepID=UPI001CC613A9|nr:TonB-dependent receptor [Ferruginibacter albus]UAY51363.1 TonB-dependent receptor [Ferruginibacter albus]